MTDARMTNESRMPNERETQSSLVPLSPTWKRGQGANVQFDILPDVSSLSFKTGLHYFVIDSSFELRYSSLLSLRLSVKQFPRV
jgi:hypothetical protein